MKITCEDNHGCYRAYLGYCMLPGLGPNQYGDFCQGYVLSKRTNCFQLCLGKPNKIERYTVDFQLYNQVFFFAS